jgi:hypothetical protein
VLFSETANLFGLGGTVAATGEICTALEATRWRLRLLVEVHRVPPVQSFQTAKVFGLGGTVAATGKICTVLAALRSGPGKDLHQLEPLPLPSWLSLDLVP